MTRLAFPATLIAFMTMVACGGGNGSPPDSGIIIPDTPDAAPQLCDPVAQTGCEAGEKCAWEEVSADPRVGRTACMPDGNVDLGDPCQSAGVGQTDECRAGSHCINNTCTQICSANPETCPSGELCSLYANFFEDQAGPIGACTPTCDPVMQTCSPDQACFLANWTGVGTCGFVPTGAQTKVQDQVCYGPQAGVCYANGCAKGFSTFRVTWPDYSNEPMCMQMCTPAATGIGQLDYITGNPNGVVCGAWDVSAGEIANTECRYFNNILLGDGADTPDLLGICLSETARNAIGLGSCTTHDLAAEANQTNVDNGTYVLGCEPWTDLTPAAARNGGQMPEYIIKKQREIQEKLQAYYENGGI